VRDPRQSTHQVDVESSACLSVIVWCVSLPSLLLHLPPSPFIAGAHPVNNRQVINMTGTIIVIVFLDVNGFGQATFYDTTTAAPRVSVGHRV
jgi:hypothetical protein